MIDQRTAIKQLNTLKKHPSVKQMRLAAEGWKSDFETLISIILSARTRDETTIKVCKELFKKYSNSKKLSKAKNESVEKMIFQINFYKNKTNSIIACSKALEENHKGKVPHVLEELIKLPGVGRKTANVFLSEVGKDGIGVDTHVQYCSKKLGWTESTKPEKIEEDLKKLFPVKYWNSINTTLVRFGKSNLSKKKKDEFLEEVKAIK